jgi:DNA mismatch repair ATPase MutS
MGRQTREDHVMRYLLLLVFLVGCGVKPVETERDIERYKYLVEQLNKINASTYTTKEIQSELKENTDLLKSVKDMTEKIQKSLEEKPAFVEVDPADVQKEVEQVFPDEPKVAEPEPIVQNSVVLVKHSPKDFHCGWCDIWDTRNKPYINCEVQSVKEHSSVGRKQRKGYPYFDLIVNGKKVYGWTGSVSHDKMNAVIGKYLNKTTAVNRSSNVVPQLKWSVGSARNPWNPTREEVISHLMRDHRYNVNSLQGKSMAELVDLHNRIHNGNSR